MMNKCPKCGSVTGALVPNVVSAKAGKMKVKCKACGYAFEVKD